MKYKITKNLVSCENFLIIFDIFEEFTSVVYWGGHVEVWNL